jgi:hypothetical protein
MGTLSTELRNKLERTCVAARNLGEKAARAALEAMAVHHHEAYGHMGKPEKDLRNKLRARARQDGDVQDAKGQLPIKHLAQECAYEHWHRMLFARFLAENHLLIEPEMGVAVSLEECKEMAKEAKTNLWALAGRYAQTMLPEIFRTDDPVLQVQFAREDQIELEELLDGLAKDTFVASDSLGWCYQFWQAERKKAVNKSELPIGADELPSVTQLFTEDYMVDFLLDNTLGAWWAGRLATANGDRFSVASCPTEEAARKICSLPGVPWKYLRFVKKRVEGVEVWTPAAGTFEGWPKTAKELRCLDPCCGSGHFIVAMFERLVALLMAEEKLDEKAAVAAVVRENLFGLEVDPRCTQIGAFSLAFAAWRRVGYCLLPAMNVACSGLAPNTREADWLKIAGDDQKLQRGMERLYRLFREAPVLGSLINPRAGERDLLVASFHELQPLLEKALAHEAKDDTAHEVAVTARGLAKAAEILAGQFTLVATNVPYLTRQKQDEVLMDFCERCYPDSKADLATCFVERCIESCASGCTTAIITPQNWLFLGRYAKMRAALLQQLSWEFVVRLGEGGFESPQAAGAFTAFVVLSRRSPTGEHRFGGLDVSDEATPAAKDSALLSLEIVSASQLEQVGNPDARVTFAEAATHELLSTHAESLHGQGTFDSSCFVFLFWELAALGEGWIHQQTSPNGVSLYSGCSSAFRWEDGAGMLAQLMAEKEKTGYTSGVWRAGTQIWGKKGVVISLMRSLDASLYCGGSYDTNVGVIFAENEQLLPSILAFCTSPEFEKAVRAIDQKLNVTCKTLAKVPFDLAHWQKVASEKYPHGLPKPFSSDPTQWLFNGHPKGSEQPLQVALARLVGYQWPRQTGSSFRDCAALGPDGLEKLADDDGIVCIPPVRGEEPAAERLRKVLAAAYGKDWKAGMELEFIRATGSDAGDLEEWLRNDFFEQHCDLFHQRPFIWHVWDGRKRDGFHAPVNYHRLAAGDKGRRTLENLTHSYLGDWITRQKDSLRREEEGAEERLAAPLALKERLESILAGEPPFDIFVRWKALACQPVGWQPDIYDGVRVNIRPFLTSDIPGGKKGAGILRARPNIKWDKDRGKEPKRDKAEFPWFWNGSGFTGDRVNDVHLTIEEKQKARE